MTISNDQSVAILGMAGRFPKARDLDTYWLRIARGEECIAFFTPADVDPAVRSLVGTPGYVMAAGVLDGIDEFDANLFRMSAGEAALTDPQHRLFLECAWEAFEDAGYGDPGAFPGVVAVYAGSMLSSYAARARGHAESGRDELHALVAAGVDYLPMLTSYRLDLRGESLAVQAACSTSLVAVHMGCQSLLTGQADMVVAGAASIDARQRLGYRYEPQTTASPDGHCRPFSHDAQGTVRGFGVGAVVLRRLEDALADGDPIRAVIRGSAVTNDGRERIGFTAPSVAGQARAIATAIAMAGVESRSIGYVEAHGTGTPLGDAMEVQALTRAFASSDQRFCALGSVKANLGHLSEASGMASLIKTVLALERRARPGLFNFSGPHPSIDLARSPFWIERETQAWNGAGPRRAGVSGYAVGGTNAHLVLEEAVNEPPRRSGPGPWLFAISAGSPAALLRRRQQLIEWLRAHPGVALEDVAWTLAAGRRALSHRCAIIASTDKELAAALETAGATPLHEASTASPIPESLAVAAERWTRGEPVVLADTTAKARRLRMPTYPFERQRHSLEARATGRVHGLTWWLDTPDR